MGTPGTKLSRVLSALSSKTHQAEEKVTAANTGRGAPHGCADKEKKYGHISREQHRAIVWVSIIGDRANVAQRKIQGEVGKDRSAAKRVPAPLPAPSSVGT